MTNYYERYGPIIDQFEMMDPAQRARIQQIIDQYLNEHQQNVMSTSGARNAGLEGEPPPPNTTASGGPIDSTQPFGEDGTQHKTTRRDPKEVSNNSGGGGGGGGQPPIADQGSGSNFPVATAPPPPPPNTYEQNIRNVGGVMSAEDLAKQDQDWQAIMAQASAGGYGQTDATKNAKWNDRAKGWRGVGEDTAYGAGVIDPRNDYGDDSWMNTMASNDDITLSTTPGWGQASMGAMPESWKGEMAGWSEDLRKMAEEYYASGKEEEFQRTRNVARAQNNRRVPGQNQSGQPNNGVVGAPIRDTSKEAPEGPNVVSNVATADELEEWNRKNVPGYGGTGGQLTQDQIDEIARNAGIPGYGGEQTDNRPPQHSGPQVGVPTDVNGGVNQYSNVVIPPLPGSMNGSTGNAGTNSLNTGELKDIFKNKKKVQWNDRGNPLGNLPKLY